MRRNVCIVLCFLLLGMTLNACQKEDEYNPQNPVDLSTLQGTDLLVAKKWEMYRSNVAGIITDADPPNIYDFRSNGTYTERRSNGFESGQWSASDLTAIGTLTIDNQDWTVLLFNQNNLILETDQLPVYQKMYLR